MSRKRSNKQRLATAFHEAGHAVAAFALHLGVKRVSIVAEGDSWGHVLYAPLRFSGESLYDLTPVVRDRFERHIVAALAGPEAARLIKGRYDRIGASSDYVVAGRIVGRLVGSAEEAQAYMRWLEIRSRQLIRAPHLRPGLEALAMALLERGEMDGRTARDITHAAMMMAARSSAHD